MKLQRAVAIRLSKILLENEMTQYALSKKMCVPQTTIMHIIHEDYKSINLATVVKIADALGMTFQEFFDDKVFERTNLDIE